MMILKHITDIQTYDIVFSSFSNSSGSIQGQCLVTNNNTLFIFWEDASIDAHRIPSFIDSDSPSFAVLIDSEQDETDEAVEILINLQSGISHFCKNGTPLCGSRHTQNTISTSHVNCEKCYNLINS